jgi:hypothetical protein
LPAWSLTLDYSHLQPTEGEDRLSVSLGFLADRSYAEREESSGYMGEQFIERVSSTWMSWHLSARMLASSQATTVLLPGYMVHD